MRFKVTADAQVLEKYSVALKGQVIPTDLIDGTYDVGETNSKSVDLTKFATENGINTYSITITEILYTNYNRAFSALAYATVTYADGDVLNIAADYDFTTWLLNSITFLVMIMI